MRPAPVLAAALALASAGCGLVGRRFFPAEPLAPLEALFSAQRYTDVVKALHGEQIQKLPRRARPRAYDLLGLSFMSLGDHSRALQVLQLAEGIYPRDLNVLTDLAHVLHYAGLDDRARPYYERVLAIHPNNARSNLGLAEIFHAQGFLARSAEHYERALSEWNMHAFIWRDYARVLAEQSRLEAAETAARKALTLAREPESLLLLARVARRLARRPESYSLLDEASAAQPERVEFRLQKALWLLEDNRLEEARGIAAALLKKRPDDELAHWIKASVALRRGQRKEARAELEAAAASGKGFVARISKAMLEALP